MVDYLTRIRKRKKFREEEEEEWKVNQKCFFCNFLFKFVTRIEQGLINDDKNLIRIKKERRKEGKTFEIIF